MKTIYFVRHGQTDYNKKHIIQGSGIDSSLNERGREQAQLFFEYYKHLPIDKIFISKLRRTKETMQPFFAQGIPYEATSDINEIGWGIHEGKKAAPWMVNSYKALIAEWQKGNFDAKIEGGESAASLANRLSRFIERLRGIPAQHILVCLHGRALRCLMCLLRGEHLREMENHKHANTGLFLVKYDGQAFEVVFENDVRHLG